MGMIKEMFDSVESELMDYYLCVLVLICLSKIFNQPQDRIELNSQK